MKKLGLGILSLAFVFAFVVVADAQSVKTGGKNDSAKSITISGEIDFPWVHRNESMNEVLDRSHAWDVDANTDGTTTGGNNSTGGTDNSVRVYQKDDIQPDGTISTTALAVNNSRGAGPINSAPSDFVNPQIRINFDIELAEKVSALISLETKRLDSDPFAGNRGVDDTGLSVFETRQDWGSNANKNLVGDENFSLTIGQAYVKVSEFLLQQLSLKIGIQDLKYDLRGNGQCWFMDVRHSEYAFLSPTTENFGPEGSTYGYSAFNPNSHAAGIFRDEISSPGGAKITFSDGDTLFVDVFAMKTLETRNFFGDFNDRGVLDKNRVNQRRDGETQSHFDEDIYGLNVDYNIPDSKSILNFVTTAFSGDSGSSLIWTVGGGADYFIDALEIFGEIYGQWGTYGNLRGNVNGAAVNNQFGDNIARTREARNGQPFGTSLDRESIDHESWMLHAGLKYTFDMSVKPWVEVSGAYVDGDDGDVDDDDNENNDFVSYENNNETLILEDSTFGLDVDSNYWKIALGLGITASLDHQDDFKWGLTWTYAEVATTPDRVGRTTVLNRALGVGDANNVDSRTDLVDVDDQLGHELDWRTTWHYSESLSFNFNAGWLIDPEFFTSDSTYRASGDMYIITLDTNLKF
ncbi:MAG: hypothetical protein HYZ53_12440 [Planctomycetes bacterium]|nr:hypothetical protein [Planctomycetota bacterium]